MWKKLGFLLKSHKSSNKRIAFVLYVSVNTLNSLQNAPHSYRFILCWLANNVTDKTNFSEWKKGTNSIYTLWSNIIHTHISAFFMCSALDRAMNIFFCLLKLCLKWCFHCCSAVGEPIVIFFSSFFYFSVCYRMNQNSNCIECYSSPTDRYFCGTYMSFPTIWSKLKNPKKAK